MKNTNKIDINNTNIKKYPILIGVVWAAFVVTLLFCNVYYNKSQTLEIARSLARASFEKDLIYRRWASKHGGVYVPITKDTPPSPYLSHIERRDITTTSGQQLTLLNPAYMTRLVQELGGEQYGIRGHITSLNPLRPENYPDPWERSKLEGFEENNTEVTSLEILEGQHYMRLMRPMMTEQSCLKCHASQGYKVGDIRGGISTSVPMEPLWASENVNLRKIVLGYLSLLILGLAGIATASWHIIKRIYRYEQAQKKIANLAKFPSEDPNPVLRISKDGKVLYSNVAGKLLLTEWKSEIGETIPEKWCNLIAEAFISGQGLEEEVVAKDRIFSTTIIPVIESKYVNLYARDITERKIAEKELDWERRFSEEMIDAIPGTFYVWSEEGKLVRWNEIYETRYGYTDDEICKMTIENWFGDDEIESVNDAVRKCFEEGESHVEAHALTKDGLRIPSYFTARRLEIDDKRYLVGVGLDITERKRTEEQLEIAKQKAEAANEAKSQFLANMSHEIRTPMNAIMGFSDLLADEDLTDDQKEDVNIIRESGHNLTVLIDDILDLSKIEAGQLNTEIINCSLADLLDSVGVLMKPKAAEKGLEYKVVENNSLPAHIQSDPSRLHQCLINLIGNAIKFTETGYVHMNVSLEDKNNQPYIRFDVEDTGIGIPLDKQEAIFELFTQADGSTSREFGGTGLGLAITRQLAELLGGELTLTSEIEKGSVFSLVIPANVDVTKQPILDRNNISDSTDPAQIKDELLEFSGNVLVAEDVPTNQVLIESLLKRLGLQVTIAKDGNEALQKAMTHKYDLIFMDIMMPHMNGFEATEAIRKEGITTPIIALTANAMKGDDVTCIEAGCDEYLAKPLDRRELLKTIGKYLTAKEPALNGTSKS